MDPRSQQPPPQGPRPPAVPVKAFKLLPEKEHTHDGIDLKPGDVVYLNESQALAFKDKFTAADNVDFHIYTDAEMKSIIEKETQRRFDERKGKPLGTK